MAGGLSGQGVVELGFAAAGGGLLELAAESLLAAAL